LERLRCTDSTGPEGTECGNKMAAFHPFS